MKARQTAEKPTPLYPKEPGLHLVVAFVEGAFSIVRAAPVRDIRRFRLRAPQLVEQNVPMFPGAASETVLAVLDKRGQVLESFGWPTVSQAFFDGPHPEVRGGLAGSPGDARLTHRILRVPVQPEAAFLFFYVTELPASGERRISRRALALYPLTPKRLKVPKLPIPLPYPIEARPLPPFPPRRRLRRKPHPRKPRPRRPPLALVAARSAYVFWGGFITDYFILRNTGPSGSRFNIVIVGDGFLLEEDSKFLARAKNVAQGLLTIAPFDALAGLINIYVVTAASWESGVDNCPVAATYKNTYYNVEGDFRKDGSPGFFGTHNPWRVWFAADLVVPIEDVDLMIVLVNVDYRGGAAHPEAELAFLSHWDTDADDVNIAAHEAAHVLIRNAEEYIGCNPHDALVVYPNQATEEEVTAKTVKWRSLAVAGEMVGGDFAAVHRQGDPFDTSGEQPLLPASVLSKLGLFWGCQDIDPSTSAPTATCSYYQQPEGRRFYRPMAKCKMRRRGYPFCRVCSTLLATVILNSGP